MGVYAPAVAVDFDGVVHRYSKGWLDGTIYDDEMPGALDGIRNLQRNGFAVFIFTTRDASQVANWIHARGLDVTVDNSTTSTFWNDTSRVLVTNRKLAAVAYLDDRSIRFTSWDDVRQQVHELMESKR